MRRLSPVFYGIVDGVLISTFLAATFAAADPVGALVAILGALSGIGGIVLGFFVWRQSVRKDKQQNEVAERAVKVEERNLGAELTDSLLGRQGEWIDKQAKEIRDASAEIRGLKEDLAFAENDAHELRRANTQLRWDIARYKARYGELPDD